MKIKIAIKEGETKRNANLYCEHNWLGRLCKEKPIGKGNKKAPD